MIYDKFDPLFKFIPWSIISMIILPELSETALIICFLFINAGKIEERAGKSKPCTSPSRLEISSTCQTLTSSDASRTPSTRSSTAEIPDVNIRTERRFIRSATRPPIRVAKMVGTAVAAPRNPRSSADPLSSKTSQALLIKYSCVLPTEAIDPNQKRR